MRSAYKVPNFPPIPGFLPFQPCFYINIEEEVPAHYYQLCRHLLYRYYGICYSNSVLYNAINKCFYDAFRTNFFPPSSYSWSYHVDCGFYLYSSDIVHICFPIGLPIPKVHFSCLKVKKFILLHSILYIDFLRNFISFFPIFGHYWKHLGVFLVFNSGFINGATLVDAKHQFVGALFIIFGFGWATMFGITVYLGKLVI